LEGAAVPSELEAGGPPFPPGYRTSGILLHVTSLPSRYGIGDLGPSAYQWIDRLHEAGQSWWQALPLGPTGYGNSPYQLLSSFAGNDLLISPDLLISDGLLRRGDRDIDFPGGSVQYDAVVSFKHGLIETAWENFAGGARRDLWPAYEQYCDDQRAWLEDYALFRSFKQKINGAHYLDWPVGLVRRDEAALQSARRELAAEIDQVRFGQFLLQRQAEHLKEYAHSKDIGLIGDLPFFVSPDSSDLWANPEFFLLDDRLRPRFLAGVPPDYFSSEGQSWGNPVYNWDALRSVGFRWYIDRLRALLTHVDMVRLDHFRGFAAAWHVPVGAKTAQIGQWAAGPGESLFDTIQAELGRLPFIAEDLGIITPDVVALRDQFQIPGTRVLQFAFDGHPDNPYLPENFGPNAVVYTGTHDNPTTRQWYEELDQEQRSRVWKELKHAPAETSEAVSDLIHLAWSSVAGLAIAPLQDILHLGGESRMNVPGRAEGNWRWRYSGDLRYIEAFDWLRELTEDSSRAVRADVPHQLEIAEALS
jgi:4-alpha-glucanotransferase